jgi:hypothetical protein
MPKVISRTIADILIGDVIAVQIQGALDVPADMTVTAVAQLRDDVSGDAFKQLAFSVFPNAGTLTALSNILKTDILADANAALQSRGDTDVQIPPP